MTTPVRRSRFKKIMGGMVLAALTGFWVYYADLLRLNFPSPKRFPVQGVDVSHHQGHIGWFEAGLNGVQFAYIKATEGADFRDPKFLYNWTQCAHSGIARGAYHYFSFCSSGAAQAKNFLATVPIDPHALPPALDLELGGGCERGLTRARVQRDVAQFVEGMSRRFKRRPVFYVTPEFYKRFIEGHRNEYPVHDLWIRNVTREPSLAPCVEWSFWQYGSLGHIPGIPGPVDLNVFCGTPEQFAVLHSTSARINGYE